MKTKTTKEKIVSPKVYIPTSSEDIESILLDLIKGYEVIVNVSSIDETKRYRYIDFLSGFIVGRKGKRTKLDHYIYCFHIESTII